ALVANRPPKPPPITTTRCAGAARDAMRRPSRSSTCAAVDVSWLMVAGRGRGSHPPVARHERDTNGRRREQRVTLALARRRKVGLTTIRPFSYEFGLAWPRPAQPRARQARSGARSTEAPCVSDGSRDTPATSRRLTLRGTALPGAARRVSAPTAPHLLRGIAAPRFTCRFP